MASDQTKYAVILGLLGIATVCVSGVAYLLDEALKQVEQEAKNCR